MYIIASKPGITEQSANIECLPGAIANGQLSNGSNPIPETIESYVKL